MLGTSLGIDFGTETTRICSPKGILLDEPTCLAVDTVKNKIFEVGKSAYDMIGRTPDSIEIITPLEKGVISNYHYASKLLKRYVKQVCALHIIKPTTVVSVPSGVTEVERRAFLEATFSAGARKVLLLEEAVAAAIGANLNFMSPNGIMSVNIGAGRTDIAVLSIKDIVTSLSKPVGGNDLDREIIDFMYNKYSLQIGDKTAKDIKINYCCAVSGRDNGAYTVKGRDVSTGLPKSITLGKNDAYDSIESTLNDILLNIRQVLENTPPELAGDIFDNGVSLSGGTARLKDLDKAVLIETGVKAIIADTPELCVAKGTARTLKISKAMVHSGSYDISQFNFSLSDLMGD